MLYHSKWNNNEEWSCGKGKDKATLTQSFLSSYKSSSTAANTKQAFLQSSLSDLTFTLVSRVT